MAHNGAVYKGPVNDDTIQCLFFSPILGSDLTLWDDLCQQLNDFIRVITKDYIWHRDEFLVYIPIDFNSTSTGPGTLSHLCSTTCFGDNLEDEWFIVYVIFEISKQYPNLIVQVKDNDGDFLLIEAANHLQSWANPDNTENRVFIYNHHIHIIPPNLVDLQIKLELEEALNIINEKPKLTQAPHDIQQAIKNRIGNYPDKISQQIHRAVMKLPSNLATLLTLKPPLVAPIVNAYCNHDIIDSKYCKDIAFDDCVMVDVKFTQFLYAALKHSKLIKFANNYVKKEDVKENMLGLKLICGFQIIMNKALVNDPFSSKQYYKFLNSLKENGYFKNNIEGSKEYTNLLQKAQLYFSTVEHPVSSNVHLKISEMMETKDFKRVKDLLKNTPVENLDNVGDNEDWLSIHPEQLNDLLYTRYGKLSKLKENDIVTPQTITKELSSFLKQTSDFEGIELGNIEESEPDDIDFQSDQFVSCIEKMLSLLSTGDKEDTETNDSDEDYEIYSHEDDNSDDDNDCDIELKAKLQKELNEDLNDNTVFSNFIQSIKEEHASTGPSSNLLRSVGVSKTELLDSDDD